MFAETTNFIFTGSAFLWSAVFVAIAIGLTLLIQWIRRKSIETKWFDWLFGILGLVLLVFTIQNSLGSLEEAEPTAAWMFLVVTGIPSLVLMAVAVQLVIMRRRRSVA